MAELLQNPGFENGDTVWVKSDPLFAQIVESPSDARSGSWVAQVAAIRYPLPSDPFRYGQISQTVNIADASRTHTLSAWVRSTGTTPGHGKVQLLLDGAVVAEHSTSDGQWARMSYSFKPSGASLTVAIKAVDNAGVAGAWLVDDVSLSYTPRTKRVEYLRPWHKGRWIVDL